MAEEFRPFKVLPHPDCVRVGFLPTFLIKAAAEHQKRGTLYIIHYQTL